MKKFLLCLISIFLFFSFLPQSLFAAESTKYDDINFPQWTKDLRRTEIITFGSLPFVTLWTTVGYSLYQYGEFRNPLDKSTDSFTEDDQWKIIKISAATCVGLGLTDLAINLIARTKKESRLRKLREMQPYTVTPAKDRKPPKMHEDESDQEAEERLKHEKEMEESPLAESFIEGVESAIF
ncbi:hypothetical protein DYE50_04795 [Treponema ruminis]|uniref:Uncharacterized protein n=1 Tax=Treponema ruminis TaxID=744515 RepID=A0A7W8G7L0_9SPIR|nr:hypothetical protein [Treponema ruminis]MBB5225237.1 hypothetical protein [Treponema ruminis]QSI01892.1 hypothetical protein DYE50_04795 [Treponema ruminis]